MIQSENYIPGGIRNASPLNGFSNRSTQTERKRPEEVVIPNRPGGICSAAVRAIDVARPASWAMRLCRHSCNPQDPQSRFLAPAVAPKKARARLTGLRNDIFVGKALLTRVVLIICALAGHHGIAQAQGRQEPGRSIG